MTLYREFLTSQQVATARQHLAKGWSLGEVAQRMTCLPPVLDLALWHHLGVDIKVRPEADF